MGRSLGAIAARADAEVLHGGPRPGLSWRHLATILLLVLTVPVFLAGAVAALPVLLFVGAVEGLRRVWLLRCASDRRRPV